MSEINIIHIKSVCNIHSWWSAVGCNAYGAMLATCIGMLYTTPEEVGSVVTSLVLYCAARALNMLEH